MFYAGVVALVVLGGVYATVISGLYGLLAWILGVFAIGVGVSLRA